MDLFAVGVHSEDFPIPPSGDPVECGVAEHHPDSFRLLRVVIAMDFQKDGVPPVFRAHGGAAVIPGEVRGEGLAKLGVAWICLDLKFVVFEILDVLRCVPVFLRDFA
eukprot:3837630-Heterocapsa_arctica.AAC.1